MSVIQSKKALRIAGAYFSLCFTSFGNAFVWLWVATKSAFSEAWSKVSSWFKRLKR